MQRSKVLPALWQSFFAFCLLILCTFFGQRPAFAQSGNVSLTWNGACYTSQVGGSGNVTLNKTWNGANYDVVLDGSFSIFSPTYGYTRKALPPGFLPLDATAVYKCSTQLLNGSTDTSAIGNGVYVSQDTFLPGSQYISNGVLWFPDKFYNGTYTLRCTWQTSATTDLAALNSCNGVTVAVSSYNLSVSKSGAGAGTVTSSAAGINCGATCAASYNANTVVNLTVTAATGSVFTGWSGACTGTGACQVTMDAAKNVVATFGIASPALSISNSAPAFNSQNIVVPVNFTGNGRSISAVDFKVNYDKSCVSFDANNGVSGVPSGFSASAQAISGGVQLLIVPDNPGAINPPLFSNGAIVDLTFGVAACATTDGSRPVVNFSFANDAVFGDDQGNEVSGNLSGGAYTLRFNANPTNLLLTGNSVNENQPAGVTAGALSSTNLDADVGDGHSYSLATTCANNGVDNSAFTITGATLQTATSFNYETKASYAICWTVTDNYGGSATQEATITINNLNDAPVANADFSAAASRVIVGDGVAQTLDVLANDTDEDAGTTLTISSVTNSAHGTVQNNTSNLSFTGQENFYGPDSFSYTINDNSGAANASATGTVNLYVVANDSRGDCNRNGKLNAADFPAIVREIFDTDTGLGWWLSYEGGYQGSPRGCDANGSENGASGLQPSVTSADIICAVRLFFGQSCSAVQAAVAQSTPAQLNVATGLSTQPGAIVNVPVNLVTGGNRVAAATFALAFDPAYLNFDATDSDGNGLPDAIALNLPAGVVSSVNYNAVEHRIELAVYGVNLPLPLLTSGQLATVQLHVNNSTPSNTTTLALTLASAGDDEGNDVTTTADSATLQITGAAANRMIYLPVVVR